MCDQDHSQDDLKEYEVRGLVTRKQFGIMLGAGIAMMLHCLEAAIGRDGDLKLAAVSPEAEIVLQLLQKAGVFQEFASSDEAVRSFAAVSSAGISKSAPASVSIFADPGHLKKAS